MCFVLTYIDTHLIIITTDSSRLQLHHSNNKVRAIPEKRCILILREIPKETPKEVRLSFIFVVIITGT